MIKQINFWIKINKDEAVDSNNASSEHSISSNQRDKKMALYTIRVEPYNPTGNRPLFCSRLLSVHAILLIDTYKIYCEMWYEKCAYSIMRHMRPLSNVEWLSETTKHMFCTPFYNTFYEHITRSTVPFPKSCSVYLFVAQIGYKLTIELKKITSQCLRYAYTLIHIDM